MDEQVLAAMARWPNVPAAHGWLSLSRRGQWLLHPHGQAWGGPSEEPGEAITNPQITAFMSRNYQSDAQGCWFFQNGPQRVYVRLDGAPWILRTVTDDRGRLQLHTHTDQAYGPVTHWWLDDDGCLYTQAGQGAGLITDRDLAQVIEALHTTDGEPLSARLETFETPRDIQGAALSVYLAGQTATPDIRRTVPPDAAPIGWLQSAETHAVLGFVRSPPRPDQHAKISA